MAVFLFLIPYIAIQIRGVAIFLVSAFPDFKELDGLLQRATGGIEFIGFDSDTSQQYLAAIRDAKGADRIVKFLQMMLAVNEHPHQKILSVANADFRNFRSHHSNIGHVVDHIIENFSEISQLCTSYWVSSPNL